ARLDDWTFRHRGAERIADVYAGSDPQGCFGTTSREPFTLGFSLILGALFLWRPAPSVRALHLREHPRKTFSRFAAHSQKFHFDVQGSMPARESRAPKFQRFPGLRAQRNLDRWSANR